MKGAAQKNRMFSLLDRAIFVLALVVALLPPIARGMTIFAYESQELRFKAELTANLAARYIYANEAMWKYQKVRLTEIIHINHESFGSLVQRIVDNDGISVVSVGERPGRSTFKVSSPVVVRGATVAHAEVEASLDPILINIAWVALVSLVLGASVFAAMRLLPLRALSEVISRLEGAHREIAAKNEALEDKNRTLEQSEQTLIRSEAALRLRSDELVEAQRLGRIGGWSYRLGASDLWWSPQLYELLRYPPTFVTTRDAVLGVYVGDGAARVLASQAEMMRTRRSTSTDVKVRRGDGTIGDFVVLSRPMQDETCQIIGFLGAVQDITERKNAEKQLEQLAYYDPLTGLANRGLFRRRLEEVSAQHNRTGKEAALLLLDLDRFKSVNDSLGHSAGDELLTRVSHVMSRVLGNGHFLARLGGDEFAAIVTDYRDSEAIAKVAEQIIAAVSEPIELHRGEASVGVSIGIALMPRDGANPADLRSNADMALYHAKEHGGGKLVFFDQDISTTLKHKLMLARDLRRALTNGEGLAAHYQPLIDLKTGSVMGFEALMRWTHPELGPVHPSEFIPIAESSTLICDIGLWILREAARQNRAWLDAGERPRMVSVNVSAAQIWHTDLAADVARVLGETGLPPELLCLELTESLMATHGESVVRSVLIQLKELGVTLALDDFGTGYSSLGYLNQLPFDKIKIDRVFVNDLANLPRARKLLEGIVALCHGLGMTIVAEGAETAEEVAILRELNCHIAQGFFYARPMPGRDAITFARMTDGLGVADRVPPASVPAMLERASSAA